MKHTLFIIIFFLTGLSKAQTVTIGNQVWMAKNLDVSTFRNGDPIPEVKTDEEWEKAGERKQPAWCYYNNDPANGAKYGKLYNWYAVNDPRGLAPIGYHIPSDAEWTQLTDFLGGESVAGTKMKGKSGWDSHTTSGSKPCPNCVNWNAEYRRKVACHTCQDTRSVPAPKVTKSGNGTNISGFSGLPGSTRSDYGSFSGIGSYGHWWSSTEDDYYTLKAFCRTLNYTNGSVGSTYDNKGEGLSVRCVKD